MRELKKMEEKEKEKKEYSYYSQKTDTNTNRHSGSCKKILIINRITEIFRVNFTELVRSKRMIH